VVQGSFLPVLHCHSSAMHLFSSFVTGRKAGIKITFVGLFWFLRPGATHAPIIVKFGREEEAANILLIAKVENFRGSFGEFRPKN